MNDLFKTVGSEGSLWFLRCLRRKDDAIEMKK